MGTGNEAGSLNLGRAGRAIRPITEFLMIALMALTVVFAGACLAAPAPKTPPEASIKPYVVRNDRGGYILDRLRQLNRLRSSGRRVEIRGNICYSTCTMFLGLPNTCVSPKTTFGFHGPSASGKRLDAEQFEYFSRVISRYYPAPLRDWYMSTGRYRIFRVSRINGTEIIKMGVPAC